MINGCVFNEEYLKFHTGNLAGTSNIFTLVVGRNGSGKSRLLKGLVNSFADISEYKSERGFFDEPNENIELRACDYNFKPNKVIASSTSPFDKFPVDRRKESVGYYEYLGLRGLSTLNLSLAFMAKTIGSLVRAINQNPVHGETVVNVLHYLGYYGVIKARFALEPSPNRLEIILAAKDPIAELLLFSRKIIGYAPSFVRMQNKSGIEEYNNSVLDALRTYSDAIRKPRVDIYIDQAGARDATTGAPIGKDFSILLDAGFLKLRDMTLHKKNIKNPFRINDASSGEQCVVMALLGIAGHIEDGSLICIDEPEICLHPEWQEKYIELLMSTFSSFKNCHFVIATHSPQIVSNLGDHNCYVLDMHTGETLDASVLNKKSADFQLARIFKTPGFRNEYVSREIMSALATIGSGQEISSERRVVLDQLLELKSRLTPQDPLLRLMDMLIEAFEEL